MVTPLRGSSLVGLTGSWARARSSTAIWSAAVLEPALPGRRTVASASLVLASQHPSG